MSSDLFQWRQALQHDRQLGPMTKLVLYGLAQHYPRIEVGQAKLAAETGMSRKSVGRHLEIARQKGWIHRVHRHDLRDKGKIPDKYELNTRHPFHGTESPRKK